MRIISVSQQKNHNISDINDLSYAGKIRGIKTYKEEFLLLKSNIKEGNRDVNIILLLIKIVWLV